MIDTLTAAEQRVIAHLANGLTIIETAERIGIQPQTTKTHLSSVYKKLRVRNRVEAFAALGWLTPPDLDDA